MKLNLEKGVAIVGVRHGTTKLSSGAERRTTTVRVTLPDGAEFTGSAVCHEKDTFTRKQGKKYAFLDLLKKDNQQAADVAVTKVGKLKQEVGSLASDAKAFYKIGRKDRTKLFKAVCSEYVAWTPERRSLREKSLLNRLKAKYEKPVMPVAAVR